MHRNSSAVAQMSNRAPRPREVIMGGREGGGGGGGGGGGAAIAPPEAATTPPAVVVATAEPSCLTAAAAAAAALDAADDICAAPVNDRFGWEAGRGEVREAGRGEVRGDVRLSVATPGVASDAAAFLGCCFIPDNRG